jgi:hypothetical protein
MRGVVVVLLLLLACAIALGFYLGWFNLSTSREPGSGMDIKVRVNEKSMETAAEKAKEKVKGLSSNRTHDKEAGK